MSTIGLIGLLIAFAGTAVSVLCLVAGQVMGGTARRRGANGAVAQGVSETLSWGGRIAAVVSLVALTACCGILVYCFMTGDTSIKYVVQYRSDASGSLAWLYGLSGLWAGRQGSLLFWAWLIAVFNAVVALRNLKGLKVLDNMALLVAQLVLAAFLGVLLFSESNMPFAAMPSQYFNSAGQLQGAATTWGMNALLEHWAMAIHPPTLFVGYAGLTIPFAYAIAALIANDSSKEWVVRSQRYALFSWLFLGIGIGLGAVWAYVVLGWGGYWGWDPVENASLLSWLVGVALIHSFTVYRQRGAFKRWGIMCACLTFAFVIVGTFISRSGIVQSVHAFEGDPVSLVLFGALIVLSIVAGLVGLAFRWKSFGATTEGADDVENMLSKDAAYYFNNVIMVVFTVLLAYMTVSSALPTWMPFGGESLTAGTYNTIARPLGIVYLLILAVCPLLSWGKTEGAQFWRRARVPGICALVLFAVLMTYFFVSLLPSYNAMLDAGGTTAEGLLEQGPSWYYNGLAVVGFLVASLLFFNALFLICRGARNHARAHKTNALVGFAGLFRGHASTYGGFVAHLAMSIILVGLIGSSMYVTEKVEYLPYDEETDTASEDFTIQDFTLVYTGNSIELQDNEDDIIYQLDFDVYRGGEYVGQVHPSVQLVQTTQQQKLNAGVIGFPLEDLFVVYKGVNEDGDFSMDVRVNPLITPVWIGFGLLMVGITLALVGRRTPKRASAESAAERQPGGPADEGQPGAPAAGLSGKLRSEASQPSLRSPESPAASSGVAGEAAPEAAQPSLRPPVAAASSGGQPAGSAAATGELRSEASQPSLRPPVAAASSGVADEDEGEGEE